MNRYLLAAAAVAFVTGVLHSWLGERYIIIRLLRRDNLPRLFGSDVFTKQTLRFAWHLTTVAWWGFAWLLFRFSALPALDPPSRAAVVAIGWVFVASAFVAVIGSRGRHLSWILFLAMALAVWLSLGI